MPMPRKNKNITVGGKFEAGLVTAFGNLARNKGISMREALRRVMVQACTDQQIPGIQDIDISAQERERWAPTRTFEGNQPEQPVESRSSKKSPASSNVD